MYLTSFHNVTILDKKNLFQLCEYILSVTLDQNDHSHTGVCEVNFTTAISPY